MANYICSASLKNESEAQTAFENLVKLVSRLRPDWAVSQPPPQNQQRSFSGVALGLLDDRVYEEIAFQIADRYLLEISVAGAIVCAAAK